MKSSGFGESFAGYTALFAIALFYVAMVPALQFVPPPSPAMDAAAFAAHYRDNATAVRLGSILMMTGSAFIFPLFGAMTAAMVRMGGRPYALAYTQLATGLVTFIPLFSCSFFFAAAAFRPERAVEDIYLISDIGWFFLVMPTPAALIQLVVFGIAILGDTRSEPVFPRWLAYYNIWVGILFFPGIFIPLFKGGPFAWNGLLAFWVPFVVFGLWIPVMSWQMLRLGRRLSRGELE